MLKLKENRGIKNYLGRTRILMVTMMVIIAAVASLWELWWVRCSSQRRIEKNSQGL